MSDLVGCSAFAISLVVQEGTRDAGHCLRRTLPVGARALPSSGPLLLSKALQVAGIDGRVLELLVVTEQLLLHYLRLLGEVSIV